MNLLDIFFPKRCVGCRKIGKYFCEECRKKIRPILDNERICPMCGRLAYKGITHPYCRTNDGIDGLTSFFHYEGVVQKAIKAIKYRGVSDLAKEFVGLATIPDFSQYILIPIPLHSIRYRERGFNQAEVLGKHLHIPMRTDILYRTHHTKPQAEMKRKERLENMQNVFSIHKSFIFHHSSVISFDDVFTTGATMRSAAYALKRAGAKNIWAITIAR